MENFDGRMVGRSVVAIPRPRNYTRRKTETEDDEDDVDYDEDGKTNPPVSSRVLLESFSVIFCVDVRHRTSLQRTLTLHWPPAMRSQREAEGSTHKLELSTWL